MAGGVARQMMPDGTKALAQRERLLAEGHRVGVELLADDGRTEDDLALTTPTPLAA